MSGQMVELGFGLSGDSLSVTSGKSMVLEAAKDGAVSVARYPFEHPAQVIGLAIPLVSALVLAGRVDAQGGEPQGDGGWDLTKFTPEGLSASTKDFKKFMSGWLLRVGIGAVYGIFTGYRAWSYRMDAWENREQYLELIKTLDDQVNEIKTTGKIKGEDLPAAVKPKQIKKLESHAAEYGKLINPIHTVLYVGKEAGEGFLAGSMSQVAASEALDPNTDIITTLLFLANAAYLNYIALKR